MFDCPGCSYVAAASKVRLDMQIDAILKPKKNSRPKKRKKDADEDVLDRAADEEVSRLREKMLGAAADDEQANREKLPATAKLRLLPEVLDVLRKCVVFYACFDRTLIVWTEPRWHSRLLTTTSWKVSDDGWNRYQTSPSQPWTSKRSSSLS